jgi:hypothetical protein
VAAELVEDVHDASFVIAFRITELGKGVPMNGNERGVELLLEVVGQEEWRSRVRKIHTRSRRSAMEAVELVRNH